MPHYAALFRPIIRRFRSRCKASSLASSELTSTPSLHSSFCTPPTRHDPLVANMSDGASSARRLIKELRLYQASPNDALLRLCPVDEGDLSRWEAVMKGVDGTPYEGGRWLLSIDIPPTYPIRPPKVTFETKISHPNISFTTGEICLTLLTAEHWSPAYTLSTILSAIHQLLTDPSPDSPLNVDVAALIRKGDLLAWDSLVRFWTMKKRYSGPC